jgi:hypothetical protein
MGDAAERQPRLRDRIAVKLQSRGNRHQRKRIGQPVADFQIRIVLGEALRRKLDRRDDLVGVQIGVALRRIAGQAVEIGKRHGALALGAGDVNSRRQRGERHAHIGRMGGDAGLARAEDGVHAVEAVAGRAAAAGGALVARRRRVVEVIAAGALQQVAAGGRHVAQLRRRSGQYRARQHRIAFGDERMIGKVGIRHQRADAQPAGAGLLDCR